MAEDYSIGALFIYPIKSLAGIRVNNAHAEIRGFRHDRRWMITNREGRYLSQKELPAMALIKTAILDEGIMVNAPVLNRQNVLIPYATSSGLKMNVRIFQDELEAFLVDKLADEWFSDTLGTPCHLVFMGDAQRSVNKKYSIQNENVSFANSFPYLVVSQASLDELNERLTRKITMERFRPNLVIHGGSPYFEDTIDEFSAGNVRFKCSKPCARCKIINIDQETALADDEPLEVLTTYRQQDSEINFGYRSLCLEEGSVNVGDRVLIIKKKSVFKNS
jgi:uncharacterized protein